MRAQKVARRPELQALALATCAQDILIWVNDWCWTYDPRERCSTLPFLLFPRQEEFLLWLGERERLEEDGLAEKCRDVGFTWLCCAFMLHRWLFRPGFKGGFGSRKLDLVDKIGDPDCIFEKLRFLLDTLPKWMLPAGFKRSAHDGYCKLINPANGAAITGEGGDNIGRGGRTSVYIVDEHAFLEHAGKVEAALSQNSRCKIRVSTPNGIGNRFYQIRHGGAVPVFTFRWRDDPRKSQAWYKRQCEILDPVTVAQEIDIDYAASIEGICIPAKYVLAAVDLPLPKSGRPIGGLDVADGGRNKTVLIGREGPVVTSVWEDGREALQAVYAAREEALRLHLKHLSYDAVGVGATAKGIFNASEKPLAFTTAAILGGESPSDARWPDGRTSRERFVNRRAELWWILRTRFQRAYEYRLFLNGEEGGRQHPADEMISIPHHGALIADLSRPLAFETDTGKIKIESKDDMRRRGVSSPDFADALIYAFVPPKVGSYVASGQGAVQVSRDPATRRLPPAAGYKPR